jgi:hypothetical protein
MFANFHDEAWERAEECRREAARASNTVDVVAWLSLADEWRRLSQADDIGQSMNGRRPIAPQRRSCAAGGNSPPAKQQRSEPAFGC